MDLTQALLALLTAITAASYAHTQQRLGRVERELSDVKVQLAAKPDRSEFEWVRVDLTALRADLTQIALAVGAERPRKSS